MSKSSFKTPQPKKTLPTPTRSKQAPAPTSSASASASAEDDSLAGKLMDEIEYAPPSKPKTKPAVRPAAKALGSRKKPNPLKLPSFPPSPEPAVTEKKRKDPPTASAKVGSTTAKKKVIRKDPSFDFDDVARSLTGKSGKPPSVYKGKKAGATATKPAKKPFNSSDLDSGSESESDSKADKPASQSSSGVSNDKESEKEEKVGVGKSKTRASAQRPTGSDSSQLDEDDEQEASMEKPTSSQPEVCDSKIKPTAKSTRDSVRRPIVELPGGSGSSEADPDDEQDVVMQDLTSTRPDVFDSNPKSTGKKGGKGSSDGETCSTSTSTAKRPTRAAKTRGTARLAEYNMNEIDIDDGGKAGVMLEEMVASKSTKKIADGGGPDSGAKKATGKKIFEQKTNADAGKPESESGMKKAIGKNQVEKENNQPVENEKVEVEGARDAQMPVTEDEYTFDHDIDLDAEVGQLLEAHKSSAVSAPAPHAVATTPKENPVAARAESFAVPALDDRSDLPARSVYKDLVLRLLVAKLESSRGGDWYELSRELNKEAKWSGIGAKGKGKGKGKKGEISGDDLYELYHFTVLPALKAGRAPWADQASPDIPESDDVEMDEEDLESEEEAPVPAKRATTKKARGSKK